MKKTALMVLSIIAFATLSALSIKPSQAYIETVGWVNPAHRGYDQFYHQSVVAYEEGTEWQISLMILNDWGPMPDKTQINISAIIVHFTWGKNYTHRYATPEAIAYGETRTFTVNSVTPSTSEVPELWTYEYRLYVEMVNATSGPTEIVGAWSWSNWDYDFAIYSANHLDAQQMYNKLQMLFTVPSMPFLNVSKSMVLFIQGYFEFQLGGQAHNRGDFTSAAEHYGNADTFFDEALSVYEEQGTAMENASIDYQNALGEASLITANAAMMNSYGWMFFGIGWILIGIGVIVYGAKKPKTP